MVSYFTEKWFPAVCSDIVTMSLFSTLNDLSVSFNVFSLFTSKASRTFFYTCLTLWRLFSSESSWIVHGTLWCVQWCRMTPSYLLCCLVDVQFNVSIPFFFDSPIYLPLHEQSKWYTPRWLLCSSFGLFRHRMLCKFLPDVKVLSLFTVLNSFLIFGPILGTHKFFFVLV